jgi:hypothetical protein
VGERSLHTREVAGSKPAAPIRQLRIRTRISMIAGLREIVDCRARSRQPAVRPYRYDEASRGEGELDS